MFRRLRLELLTVGSGSEYLQYRKTNSETFKAREVLTKLLASQLGETFPGHCAVCNRRVEFRVFKPPEGKPPMWRESFTCPQCGFNTRMRAFLHLYLSDLKNKQIYVTEQVTPLFDLLKKKLGAVEGSEYLGLAPGQIGEGGIRSEDLTHLSFDRNSLDRILSFEVLEHVPRYEQALTEILRCLRPGGRVILSAPFIWHLPKTLVRASISQNGEIVHHEPPDYHGNPIDANGSLCYYYFSFDLLDLMREIGFADVQITEYWSKDYVYLGTANQTYITALKPL